MISGRTHADIAETIRLTIRRGELEAGDRLPPVRQLAARLKVNRNTVSAAYKMLAGEGSLLSKGRGGTYVAPALAKPRPPEIAVLPPHARDLMAGNPDPDLLPDLRPALAEIGPPQRLYGEHGNHPDLVDHAVAQFVADGLPKAPTAVVHGALDGIERVLTAHLAPGDLVAVEDPAYATVLYLIRTLGLHPVPVSVDDRGMRPEAFARALRRPVRAVIFTPRAQNPFGAQTTPERARELRQVLDRRPEVLVIEDDHFWLLADKPAVTLAAGLRERWAVARSYSKALGPDVRVATLFGDPATIAAVESRQWAGVGWVSNLMQRLVLAALNNRGARATFAKAAREYTARRQQLIDGLARVGLKGYGKSGLNVWLPVEGEQALMQALLAFGWVVRTSEAFRVSPQSALRISIGRLSRQDIPSFLDDLARSLNRRRPSLTA